MGDMNHNEQDRRQEKRAQFIDDLMGFHAAVGTPLMHLPTIHGQEIDLLGLYEVVTSLGGWERVSDNNQWPDVGLKLALPPACVNSSVALKQIYLRFLDKYEKTHFVHKVRGELEDEVEFNIKRMNKLSARTLYTVPTTYNDEQHNLTDEQRSLLGLNSLVSRDKFDKLQLSLIAPLPNEQDFAINVCALLSLQAFENPVSLKNSPGLLVNLLAHAGVFTDVYFRDFLSEQYEKDRGYEVKHFWKDSLKHDAIVWLTNEANFTGGQEDEDCLMVDMPERDYITEHLVNYDAFVERICQIAKIILNFTQHTDNASFIASDITAVRFILLCCDCRYKKISELGWDIMNCVASKISLRTLGFKEILILVKEGITSEDISEVLASLRVLSELAKLEMNTNDLLNCLDKEAFFKLCTYLTLQDVVIILCTLEALYSLSNLDKLFCDSIVSTAGSLSILVLLLKFRVPTSASFGTWKNIRVSESIVSEDGSKCLGEKDLGSLSTKPPEYPYPFFINNPPPVPVEYRRVENVSNCCATGECRRSQKDEAGATATPNDVITLQTSPKKNSLLCNALRNCAPNGVKPVTVSTVGPAITLKAHLEEPVTKIVKITNPGSQVIINSVKTMGQHNPGLMKNVGYVTKKMTLNGREFIVATPMSPPPKSEESSNSSNSDDMQDKVVTNNHNISEESSDSIKSNNEKPLHNNIGKREGPEPPNNKIDPYGPVTPKALMMNGIQEEAKVNGTPEPDDYLCEWRGCLRKFKTPSLVFVHICSTHCPPTMLEGKCLWGNCTAGKMVYRFLAKHIHREHCHPEVMLPIKARTAVRPRLGESRLQQPPPPAQPPPAPSPGPTVVMTASTPERFNPHHPGPGPAVVGMPPHVMHMPPPNAQPHHPFPPSPMPYAPSPGQHPIVYGGQPMAHRFYGPPPLASTAAGDRIAESIRLTSALILRNIASACPPARGRLLLFEQQIVESAALDSEASRAAAECLSYLRT